MAEGSVILTLTPVFDEWDRALADVRRALETLVAARAQVANEDGSLTKLSVSPVESLRLEINGEVVAEAEAVVVGSDG